MTHLIGRLLNFDSMSILPFDESNSAQIIQYASELQANTDSSQNYIAHPRIDQRKKFTTAIYASKASI